jgi:DNA-binding transcriptional LysR family regulator
MNYDYYHVFLAVGKRLSFTQAAKDLYTSQPSVTRTIHKLENELGVRLFIRSKKGVSFTPDGQTLYDYVATAFAQISKGEEQISDRVSLNGGSLSVGSTVTSLDEFLFDFLDDFHKLYPKVRYRISSQSSDGTISRLRSGLSDIAFVTTPFRPYEDISATEIKSFQNVLIAGNGIQKLKDGKHSIEEIAQYPIISLQRSMQLRQYSDEYFAKGNIDITPALEVDSASTIIPMVRHNLGVGIVPFSLAKRAIERGDIYVVGLREPLPERSVVMIISQTYPLSPVTKRFYQMVVEKIKTENRLVDPQEASTK